MKRIGPILLSCVFLFSCGKKTQEAQAEKRHITGLVFAPGTLEPDDSYNLTAQTDGYLIELRVKEGDSVEEGETLARIDNDANSINAVSAGKLLALAEKNAAASGPVLQQARIQIGIAAEKHQQDSMQAKRYDNLYRNGNVSRVDWENAQLAAKQSRAALDAAFKNLELANQQVQQSLIIQESQQEIGNVSRGMNDLKSLTRGNVLRRMKQQGDFVRRGETVLVIGDPQKIVARLSIDENSIRKVKTGQEVIVQLNVDPGKHYGGTVTEIFPSFDPASQSFIAKASFRELPEFRIAGTQLQANIIVGTQKQAVVIPRGFLFSGDQVNLKGKGKTQVKTGIISSEWVEVKEGLKEGETVLRELD